MFKKLLSLVLALGIGLSGTLSRAQDVDRAHMPIKLGRIAPTSTGLRIENYFIPPRPPFHWPTPTPRPTPEPRPTPPPFHPPFPPRPTPQPPQPTPTPPAPTPTPPPAPTPTPGPTPGPLTPPASIDWTTAVTSLGVPWGVMLNDQLGDCTVAALGHQVMIETANTGPIVVPSDDEVLSMYELSGYVPGEPWTDRGWYESVAFQAMQSQGLAGVKVDAYADINFANEYDVKQGVYLFGGVEVGLAITQEDEDVWRAHQPWTDANVNDSPVLGGHAFFIVGYDQNYLWCVTWGTVQKMTWEWLQARIDEGHVAIFIPWVENSRNLSPDNFNLQQLLTDMQNLQYN